MPSPLATRADQLLAANRPEEAAALLFSPAAEKDRDALFTLAMWRISGSIVRRDLAAARALLQRAAAAGRSDAALYHCYMLASGMGGADDWARALSVLRSLAPRLPAVAAQLRLIDRMELNPDGSPARLPDARLLSAEPRAVAFEKLFTEGECAWVKAVGEPRMTPSVVVDPRTGRMVPHPIRTSSGAIFGIFDEDLVINALNRRIAAASGTHIAEAEPLQLLRYDPGNEYRAHMDALPAEANQRVLTMLVYINDGYEGGETHFLRTGLSFKGGAGDALLFRNVTQDGRADPLAEHAGRPVTKGIKLIASRWIRARPIAFPPPRPLLGDRYG